jgi:integrase
MTGHIRRRGKSSWEIKFDLGRDPITSKRRIRYHSFKGTKRQAEVEAARLISAAATGSYIDPSRITVAQFIAHWEANWAAGNVSPKTFERYCELLRKHVRPYLGAIGLQKLRPATLAELYARLQREGRGDGEGLAARTVGHVHRVLHRALGHATQWGLVQQNVASLVSPPRVPSIEVSILRSNELNDLLKRLRGRSVYAIATLALATGMRRGELLALRWKDVDFERGLLQVEQSLEATKDGLRIKSPKTHHGRRSITLPSSTIGDLRLRWKKQLERRLALGLRTVPGEELVFGNCEGGPLHPAAVTKEWSRAMTAIGMANITLHTLRHTHASQLIAAGVDVLTVSRRLGHGSPAITLTVYGHLFSNSDDRVARIVEATFAKARTE